MGVTGSKVRETVEKLISASGERPKSVFIVSRLLKSGWDGESEGALYLVHALKDQLTSGDLLL